MKIFGVDFSRGRASRREVQQHREVSEGLSIVAGLSGVILDGFGRELTSSAALKVSVVYACTRIIAGAISQLPIRVVYAGPGGPRPAIGDSISRVLNLEPSPSWPASAYWSHVVSEFLLRGNSYSSITRDGQGRVKSITPIDYTAVKVEKAGQERRYVVQLRDDNNGFGRTRQVTLSQNDVLDFAGFGGGLGGLRTPGILQIGAGEATKIASMLDEFVRGHFENGATQSVLIKQDRKLTPDEKQELVEEWTKRYSVGLKGASIPIIASSDTAIERLSENLAQSELIANRDFQIADICRAFGIPSFLIGAESKNTTWGTGLSEIASAFVRFTLMPHVAGMTDELNRKLFSNSARRALFDTNALVRGTRAERFSGHVQALGGQARPGWLSVNEVRSEEGLPPLEGEEFDRVYVPKDSPPPPPPTPPTGPPPDDEPPDDDE